MTITQLLLWTKLLSAVDSVCGQSLFAKQENFSTLFSQNNFFSPRGDTLKSHKSKSICPIALKF